MSKEHFPPTSAEGIVLAPSSEQYPSIRFVNPHAEGYDNRGHHVCFPHEVYRSHSELAIAFRGHLLNRWWLLPHEHSDYHWRYIKEPMPVPVPSDEVMHGFLKEAVILDELGSRIDSVKYTNLTLAENISDEERFIMQDRRDARLEALISSIAVASSSKFELIIPEMVSAHIEQASQFAATQLTEGRPLALTMAA